MHVDSHCNQYLAVSISRNSAEISTISDRIQQRLLHSVLNVACVCRLCLITGLDCGLDCGLDHWTGLLNWILGCSHHMISTKSDIQLHQLKLPYVNFLLHLTIPLQVENVHKCTIHKPHKQICTTSSSQAQKPGHRGHVPPSFINCYINCSLLNVQFQTVPPPKSKSVSYAPVHGIHTVSSQPLLQQATCMQKSAKGYQLQVQKSGVRVKCHTSQWLPGYYPLCC